MAWDASMGESRKADRQAVAVVMLCKDKIMRVLDIFDRRASIEETMRTIYDMADIYRPIAVCIEDVTFQALLGRLLDHAADERGYRLPIRRVKHRLSKAARIESLSSLVERGMLQFDFARRDGSTLHEELLGYPRASVPDDGLDAVETAVSQLRARVRTATTPAFGGTARPYIAQRRVIACGLS
jgi:predicted phage terminase large subunit-like protein